jgi:hypothetical protein
LILTWINEICTADTEKRAFTVALGNDLAYVVQAVVSFVPVFMIVLHDIFWLKQSQAPNFVWKTTDFPAAKKGFLWSIILQVLLSEFSA